MAITEETVLPSVGFTEAKSGLSGLMTDVVHGHRTEVIERHRGKETAVLMSLEDLMSLLSDYRFRPQVALGDGEATAVLEDLGLVAAGADFEAAMENLVLELRATQRSSWSSAAPSMCKRPGLGMRLGCCGSLSPLQTSSSICSMTIPAPPAKRY